MKLIMNQAFLSRSLVICAVIIASLSMNSAANALNVRVKIENISPSNGVGFTPVWVGFHDGSFDSYDGGTPAPAFIEALAEDGNNSLISTEFNNVAGRIDGNVASPSGPPPLTPGESATMTFNNVDTSGANQYFSYASMVLPSNDFFLANGNPLAHNLSSLSIGSSPISILIGTTGGGSSPVNDAGTEVEDFDFVAPPNAGLNGLFPGRNFDPSAGQTAANQGTAQGANISNVTGADPFGGFANILGADLSGFDFNDASLYTGGAIGRITISAIPEPTSIVMMGLAVVGITMKRSNRRS